jgi:hypothetical protein
MSSSIDLSQDVGGKEVASFCRDLIRSHAESGSDFAQQGLVFYQDKPSASASCQSLQNLGLLEKPKLKISNLS